MMRQVVALIAALSLAVPATARAGDVAFTVINDSSYDLVSFYTAPPDARAWGHNLLGEYPLKARSRGTATIAGGDRHMRLRPQVRALGRRDLLQARSRYLPDHELPDFRLRPCRKAGASPSTTIEIGHDFDPLARLQGQKRRPYIRRKPANRANLVAVGDPKGRP